MKLYKSLFAMLAVASAAAVTGCDDDFETPPVIIPEATYEVNTAIADFKTEYWQYATGDAFAPVPVNMEGDSIIIGGTIVSSDDTGNMFKQIVVQDESGAVLIGVNASGLNEGRYKLGEEVRVNVTGLYVGNYNQLFQVGTPYEGKIGRVDEDLFNLHAQVNGLPSPEALANLTTTLTIGEIAPLKNDKNALIKYQSTRVTFNDVTFEGGGSLAWSENPGGQYYTTRYIKDTEGNRMAVNTSNRCTFASDILPKGTGSVTAILSYFKGDWQLVVCDPATDCVGYEFVQPSPAIFKETFSAGIGKFTIENVVKPNELEAVWKFDSRYGMVATGYDSESRTNFDTDSYLVSPVIDLTDQTEAWLIFDHAINFFASVDVAKKQATLLVKEDGADSWTQLTIPRYGTNQDYNFVSSGNIDLKAYAGKKIRLAFRYQSTAAKAGTWEVKNVTVQPNPADDEVVPDEPVGPTDGTVFSETFAASQGTFTVENVVMDSLEYVWKFSETYGMVASAFTDKAHASDSYLISPEIDLSGVTAGKLSFDHAVNKFENLDAVKQQCTLNIREAGTKTWTVLTIPAFGTNTNWTFVPSGDVDLSAYAGKKIQIAFRYTSTAEKAGSWEIKNVLVKK